VEVRTAGFDHGILTQLRHQMLQRSSRSDPEPGKARKPPSA